MNPDPTMPIPMAISPLLVWALLPLGHPDAFPVLLGLAHRLRGVRRPASFGMRFAERAGQAQHRLAEAEERFPDPEINPGLRLDLLVEHGSNGCRSLPVVRLPHPCLAEITGDEDAVAAGLARRIGGKTCGGLIDLASAIRLANRAELAPAAVEGHDLEHLCAGVCHLAMELADGVGMIQRHLGRERAGRHPATLLELDDVTPVPQPRTRRQPPQASPCPVPHLPLPSGTSRAPPIRRRDGTPKGSSGR